jgi:DNA-binding MarR family transcriptional regulator
MARPVVDQPLLLRLLWMRSQEFPPLGQLEIVQRDLAAELLVDKRRMSQVLQSMERKGWLTRVSERRQPAPITYRVLNPEEAAG